MQAHKPQQSFGCSLCNSYGFTLAETMIVIVVLGIIATLTIPALVNKQRESVAKTKVRKAMAAYESALNKMIIENDLKSDDTLTAWAGNADSGCANSTNYFKKVQGDGCIFKTSDGIWWNISDIERPLIAFKDTDLTSDKANSTTDMSAFVLVGRFGTDGSLRVDDLAYETNHDEDNSKTQVEKLYKLLGLKSSSSGGGTQSPFAACNGADTCTITYNCPTTDEPNKTCTMDYVKMILDANIVIYDFCDLEDYNSNKGTCGGVNNDKWQSKTSTTIAGEYYVALEAYPENSNEYAISEENCDTSAYMYCSSYGDYYNLAKTHCEQSGGRLVTTSEIKSLQKKINIPSNKVWVSDSDTSGIQYFVKEDFHLFDYYDGNSAQIICIGK